MKQDIDSMWEDFLDDASRHFHSEDELREAYALMDDLDLVPIDVREDY